MTKLINLAQREANHVIIGGEPKSGKSTLASKLAEKFKLLWISMDNGHSVLYKLPRELQEKIDIIVLPDTKDFPIAVSTMLRLIKNVECKICEAHGQVDCSTCKRNAASLPGWSIVDLSKVELDTVVILDQVSQLADSANHFVLQDKQDTYKPDWDDYGVWFRIMTRIMSAIQQAPYNVAALAHLVETVLEDNTKKLVPMVGSYSFSRKVGGYFDHIVVCETFNGKHAFGSSTTYKASMLTGSRGDITIEKMPVPSLIPFYTGEIKKPAHYGADKVIELSPTTVVDPHAGKVAAVVGSEVAGVAAQQTNPATPISTSPAAGMATSMHSTAANDKSPAELAKEALARIKAGKK